MDRRIFARQDGHALEVLPTDRDHLDRGAQGTEEQRWRIAEQTNVKAADIERLGHRRAGGELLPFQGVRQVVKHASRFHHRAGVVALVPDHQGLGSGGKAQGSGQQRGGQVFDVAHVRLQLPAWGR